MYMTADVATAVYSGNDDNSKCIHEFKCSFSGANGLEFVHYLIRSIYIPHIAENLLFWLFPVEPRIKALLSYFIFRPLVTF